MSDSHYLEKRHHELEIQAITLFKQTLSVRRLLFEDIDLAEGAVMTVFSTHSNEIFGFLETSSTNVLRLGDVQRLVKRAGFTHCGYAAPDGDSNYFRHKGRNIFLGAYPGRRTWTAEEEAYYKLLVPYSPALIHIGGISGPIYRYNRYSDRWQEIFEPSRNFLDKIKSESI